MGTPTRPVRRDDILEQQDADTLLLLVPETGMYFELDDVGARVWELCDGTRDIAEVVQAVHLEYDAPEHVITADVRELLADLAAEHLVEDAS